MIFPFKPPFMWDFPLPFLITGGYVITQQHPSVASSQSTMPCKLLPGKPATTNRRSPTSVDETWHAINVPFICHHLSGCHQYTYHIWETYGKLMETAIWCDQSPVLSSQCGTCQAAHTPILQPQHPRRPCGPAAPTVARLACHFDVTKSTLLGIAQH